MQVVDPKFAEKPTMPSDASEEKIRAALREGKPVVFPPAAVNPVIDASWIQELVDDSSECKQWILIANAEIRGALTLPYIVFRGPVSFIKCRLREEVDFTGSEFKASLFLRQSVFEAAVTCKEILVAHDLNLTACDFGTLLRLTDAEVKQVLLANGASFDESEFYRLHVSKAAFFLPAAENGRFRPVQFRKKANFVDARFDVTAEFDGAQFAGEANFSRIVVGATAFFRPAMFGMFIEKRGRVPIPVGDRPAVRFGGPSTFQDARFGSVAIFSSARFAGPADFSWVVAKSDLLFVNAWFESTLTFAAAEIGGDAFFTGVQFGQAADLRRVLVGNALVLSGVGGEIDLRRAKVDTIAIDPKTRLGPIDARMFSHKRFEGDWRQFVDAVEPFTRDPFDDIESYLRRTAEDREADSVYYERRVREGRLRRRRIGEALGGRRLRAAAADVPRALVHLFEAASGYGVKPLRFVAVALILIAIGTYAFSRRNAVVTRTAPVHAETLSGRAAASYAFATFIPIVRLPAAERWRAADDYEGVEMLLQFGGYLVAPLIIALVKSMISRRERG